MVIVEISAESVKACSFHQRKYIPDTEIIYLRLLDTIGSQIAFFLNFIETYLNIHAAASGLLT